MRHDDVAAGAPCSAPTRRAPASEEKKPIYVPCIRRSHTKRTGEQGDISRFTGKPETNCSFSDSVLLCVLYEAKRESVSDTKRLRLTTKC